MNYITLENHIVNDYDELYNIEYFKTIQNGLDFSVFKKIIEDADFLKFDKFGAENPQYKKLFIACDLIQYIELPTVFGEVLKYFKKINLVLENDKYIFYTEYAKLNNFTEQEYSTLLAIYCSSYFRYVVLKQEYLFVFEFNKIPFPLFRFEIETKHIICNIEVINESCLKEFVIFRVKSNIELSQEEKVQDINSLENTLVETNFRNGRNTLKEPLKYIKLQRKNLTKTDSRNFDKKISEFNFKNNFDNVSSIKVHEYFKKELVDKNYIENEKTLHEYLELAFDKQEVPEEKFSFKRMRTLKSIRQIFYKYYSEIAYKPNGEQDNYIKLLTDYFQGFDFKKVKNNFNK